MATCETIDLPHDQIPSCPDCKLQLIAESGMYGTYHSCPNFVCDITAGFSEFDKQWHLTDQETRDRRRDAHAVFDRIWQARGSMSRRAAYTWLSYALGMWNGPRDCHIKHFNVEQCSRMIELCRSFLGDNDA